MFIFNGTQSLGHFGFVFGGLQKEDSDKIEKKIKEEEEATVKINSKNIEGFFQAIFQDSVIVF